MTSPLRERALVLLGGCVPGLIAALTTHTALSRKTHEYGLDRWYDPFSNFFGYSGASVFALSLLLLVAPSRARVVQALLIIVAVISFLWWVIGAAQIIQFPGNVPLDEVTLVGVSVGAAVSAFSAGRIRKQRRRGTPHVD